MKFLRSYSMTVEVGPTAKSSAINGRQPFGTNSPANTSNSVVVNYPLTLVFDVRRGTLSSANTGHFMIYNLKESTRRLILKDRYTTDLQSTRSMTLNAGYLSTLRNGSFLPVIFRGDIRWAYSYRQKQDWVTEIEAFDGGDAILNGQAKLSTPSPYDIKQVLRNIISTMPRVGVGAIGGVASADQGRGIAVSGNSWSAIQQLVPGAEAFIDNGVANVLAKNEYISGNQVFVIDADTGLLETPRKYDDRIDVKILFEPRIHVGMLVELRSVESFFNGLFSVKGVAHSGTISGAIGGQLTTTLGVWRGTEGLKGVNG